MSLIMSLVTIIGLMAAIFIAGAFAQRKGVVGLLKSKAEQYVPFAKPDKIQVTTAPELFFRSPVFNWKDYPYTYQFEQMEAFFENRLADQLENRQSIRNGQGFGPGNSDEKLRPEQGRFLDLLGGRYLGEPQRVNALSEKVIGRSNSSELVRLFLQSRLNGMSVEAILGIPKSNGEDGGLPCVIAVHGYTSSPDKVMGFGQEDYSRNFGVRLLDRGYAVLAPFVLNHGERVSSLAAVGSLIGDTVDRIEMIKILSCVDYLSAKSGISNRRIGIYGISGGGMHCLYTSAIDRRIKCAVCSGYLRDRTSSLLDYALGRGRYRRSDFSFRSAYYFPCAPFHLEFPLSEIAKMAIPTPIFFENGERDLDLVEYDDEREFKEIERGYSKLGFGDRVKFHRHSGTHEAEGKVAFEWIDKWLKN